ncbi:MAG: CoB--CoM heterodisulfide reductase iron-sulfur subunit A family protein [Candidatus Zixiibacteriota bacterium]|nr:MAG: CoB--CoM heterodisulfide reductase iron-sulfur subunit A family protein [candidate division Zixibacteria bacterium]
MMDAGRHPNIEVLTNSELVRFEGKPGNFTATVRRHPRYVDENLCTGCGQCVHDCPVIVPNEFEVGMGARKAIYSPFPQAVPNTYIIDRENCLNDDFLVCNNCMNSCDRNAVNYDDLGAELRLAVGAVVVATGFDVYNASAIPSYGYGLYDNVLSNIELERVLNASGPTRGHIVRPSDKKVPKKIAFIQCVGSRGEGKEAGCQYCSRYCCMNAVKDCLLVKQHEPDIEELVFFYIDMRAAGRGFEEFYQRSLEMPELTYVRGRPSKILEDAVTKDLMVYVEDVETGQVSRIKVDMAVLSTGAVAGETNNRLAEVLGISLDENKFFEVDPKYGSPLHTSREGVYVCGCAAGINDISDSVSQASGAAAEAEKFVTKSPPAQEVEPAPEMDTSGPPRVGVFLCHCGINIAGVLDVESLKEYAQGIPDVAFVEENLFLCSDEGQRLMQEKIAEHRLNRVVAAACTPRTHEPVFRESCQQIGLNPYLFEMVNVRDQCSWVHTGVPEIATAKARDMIRSGVAKARHLQPLYRKSIPVNQSALVVGGGVGGMAAALELEAQGMKVYLIEQQGRLGGRLINLTRVYPANLSAFELARVMVEKIKASRVEVMTGTEINAISGFVGNFDVATTNGNFKVGTIVLATGADIYKPGDEFSYDRFENVITNQELEDILHDTKGKIDIHGQTPENVVFIQCVGSRSSDTNPGCSRYCCPTTIKQAIRLRESGVNVAVLHRDMRTVGAKAEEHYRHARELGVKFIRFTPERLPRVIGNGKAAERIEVKELALDRILDIPADYVVLAAGMVPNKATTDKLQDILKVPRAADGFFMERHAKLGPVETTTEGVFLAGCVSGPKDIADSLAQGAAAAAKAAAIISHDTVALEPTTCVVRPELCRACGECVGMCDYHAPGLVDKGDGVQVAEINQALCKGCGTCASWCPTGAIVALHFTDEQINSMLDTLLLDRV